jgi:hypothetical protein
MESTTLVVEKLVRRWSEIRLCSLKQRSTQSEPSMAATARSALTVSVAAHAMLLAVKLDLTPIPTPALINTVERHTAPTRSAIT